MDYDYGMMYYEPMPMPMQMSMPMPMSKRRANAAMKEEYAGQQCAVCDAAADGLHYGAISCRSCNAFFRRAISFNQIYDCRNGGNCPVTPDQRCGCRACRFNKCIQAGMKREAVQPRRDPTGSQKDRKRRNLDSDEDSQSVPFLDKRVIICAQPRNDMEYEDMSPSEAPSQTFLMSSCSPATSSTVNGVKIYDMNGPMVEVKSEPRSPIEEERICKARTIREMLLSEEKFKGLRGTHGGIVMNVNIANGGWSKRIEDMRRENFWDERYFDPQENFERMVHSYSDHIRHMTMQMTSLDDFLTRPARRRMHPNDVELLSKAELGGLLFWLDRMIPYNKLSIENRKALLLRFSVRKLSLDHFYAAAQNKEYYSKREFCMLNNTFVQPGDTGFELVTDDEFQRRAKQRIFQHTYELMWENVILPFTKIGVQEAEIVFMHAMQLWNVSNSGVVSKDIHPMLLEQRTWWARRMHDWYVGRGMEPDDIAVRFGQIILLLAEVEDIVERHICDVTVCKTFDFCDLSQYWYESVCYSEANLQGFARTKARNKTVIPRFKATMKKALCKQVSRVHNAKRGIDPDTYQPIPLVSDILLENVKNESVPVTDTFCAKLTSKTLHLKRKRVKPDPEQLAKTIVIEAQQLKDLKEFTRHKHSKDRFKAAALLPISEPQTVVVSCASATSPPPPPDLPSSKSGSSTSGSNPGSMEMYSADSPPHLLCVEPQQTQIPLQIDLIKELKHQYEMKQMEEIDYSPHCGQTFAGGDNMTMKAIKTFLYDCNKQMSYSRLPSSSLENGQHKEGTDSHRSSTKLTYPEPINYDYYQTTGPINHFDGPHMYSVSNFFVDQLHVILRNVG